jgi:hypothetical protein
MSIDPNRDPHQNIFFFLTAIRETHLFAFASCEQGIQISLGNRNYHHDPHCGILIALPLGVLHFVAFRRATAGAQKLQRQLVACVLEGYWKTDSDHTLTKVMTDLPLPGLSQIRRRPLSRNARTAKENLKWALMTIEET